MPGDALDVLLRRLRPPAPEPGGEGADEPPCCSGAGARDPGAAFDGRASRAAGAAVAVGLWQDTVGRVGRWRSVRRRGGATTVLVEAGGRSRTPQRRGGSAGASAAGVAPALARGLTLKQRAAIGAAAGALAGGLVNAALHPLDTIKTRLQARGAAAIYRGPVDVVRKVIAEQGLMGLYRGLPAAVAGSVPSSALYFGTYELCKGALTAAALPFLPPGSRLIPSLAAALGNMASSTILVPKEIIKQRLQAGPAPALAGGPARGAASWVLLRSILAAEGPAGLYRGYWTTLARNLPSNVINFSLFEALKAAQLHRRAPAEARGGADAYGAGDGASTLALPPLAAMATGALSGLTSAFLTTPLDVVKTRLMMQGAGGVGTHYRRGAVQTLMEIAREEGLPGLTRGMAPRLCYSALFSAVGFVAFETARAGITRVVAEHNAAEAAAAGRQRVRRVSCPGPARAVPRDGDPPGCVAAAADCEQVEQEWPSGSPDQSIAREAEGLRKL